MPPANAAEAPSPPYWLASWVEVAPDGTITFDNGLWRRVFGPNGEPRGGVDRVAGQYVLLADGTVAGPKAVTVGGVTLPIEHPSGVVPTAGGVWVRTRGALRFVGPDGVVRSEIEASGWGGVARFDGGVAWLDDGGLHVRGKRGDCDLAGAPAGTLAASEPGDRVAIGQSDALLLLDGACRPLAALPVEASRGLGFAGDRLVRVLDSGAVLHDATTLAPLGPEPWQGRGSADRALVVRAEGGRLRAGALGWEWDPVDGTVAVVRPAPREEGPSGVRVVGRENGRGVRYVPQGVQVFDPRTMRDRGPVLPVRARWAMASEDGRFAVTVVDRTLTTWDVATATPRWSVGVRDDHARPVGVDAHYVRVREGSGEAIYRTVDGRTWGTVRADYIGGVPSGVTVTAPDGAVWDSRRPTDGRMVAAPAAEAPAPSEGPPVDDRLGRAVDPELHEVLRERVDCARADTLRARWDGFAALDAAVTAAVDAACARLPLWTATPVALPPPSPPVVPAPAEAPTVASIPLRTDVPTVIVRPSRGLHLRRVTAAGAVVYIAARADFAAAEEDGYWPDAEDFAAQGALEDALGEERTKVAALPGTLELLDALAADAALVGPDGRVLASGTLPRVTAAAWLARAGVRALVGGWAEPTWQVAFPDPVVEVLPIAGGTLVRTTGELACMDAAGNARWQLPGTLRSVVPDGERVWVEPVGAPSFAVALVDGRRVAEGAYGRAIPGDPVRFLRDVGSGTGVTDGDGAVLFLFPLRGVDDVVGDEVHFRVGAFDARATLDGRPLSVVPRPPRAVRWGRQRLVEQDGTLVDRRGRVVVARIERDTLVAAGDGALVKLGRGGPWLHLDRKGRGLAVYDADRLVPTAEGLVGTTAAGYARWELP